MNVIFLDIDGCLNTLGFDHPNVLIIDPVKADMFNKLAEDTKASVVLCSGWRTDDNWLRNMRANGLTCNFIDRTPELPGKQRGDEVKMWLDQVGYPLFNVGRYAILDDDVNYLPGQPQFQPEHDVGLTEGIVNTMKEYFSEEP